MPAWKVRINGTFDMPEKTMSRALDRWLATLAKMGDVGGTDQHQCATNAKGKGQHQARACEHEAQGEKGEAMIKLSRTITLEQIREAKPAMIFYGAYTCWWTHDSAHLRSLPSGLPCGPRGEVLYQTEDVEGFLKAAEQNASHYGKHGLDTFLSAHHLNCTNDGQPWSMESWPEYGAVLDAQGGLQ